MINTNRDCPICKSKEKTFLYQQNFNNNTISLMDKYDIVSCKNCGFVYADNIPNQLDFDKYYAEMSKYEFDYNKGLVSKSYIEHFEKIVNFITPYIENRYKKENKDEIRILDIGCSTGALLSIFKSRGYNKNNKNNLYGIDPSQYCAKIAKELYGIDVKKCNISSFNLYFNSKFDLIILSAVLEHLVDLNLENIHRLLKDDGLLFIEIPDAERFDSYIFMPFQQFSIEHINYFSQYSIRNLLSINKFKIIKLKQDENRINETIDPDIFVLAKKSDFPRIENYTNNTEIKIRDYISKCELIKTKMKKDIQEILNEYNKEDKIIVWSVGTFTQTILSILVDGENRNKILFFVDSNKNYHGKKLKGIEIKSPDSIKDFPNIPILISTNSYRDEIIKQIKDLELNNRIIKL